MCAMNSAMPKADNFHNVEDITSGYHLDPFGLSGTEYACGYRRGASTSVVNGSGMQ